jgi:hypothetical protein
VIPSFYNLQETTSRNYKIRTRKNVIDSDATLLLTPSRRLKGGSLLTYNYCIKLGKPCLHLCPGDNWLNQIEGFIKNYSIERLNVAGLRESVSIEQFVYSLLDEVLCVWRGGTEQ